MYNIFADWASYSNRVSSIKKVIYEKIEEIFGTGNVKHIVLNGDDQSVFVLKSDQSYPTSEMLEAVWKLGVKRLQIANDNAVTYSTDRMYYYDGGPVEGKKI